MSPDIIRVKERSLNVALASGSRWPGKGKGTLQPISVSVDIFHDVAPSSLSDDLNLSINYSSISKKLGSLAETPSYQSLEDVAVHALEVVQSELELTSVARVGLKIIQLKAPLHCKEVGLEILSSRKGNTWNVSHIQHFLSDLICPAIIGVNDVEREEKQNVVVNIAIDSPNAVLEQVKLDFRQLTRLLWSKIGDSTYLTLEALTFFIAQNTLTTLQSNFASDIDPKVTVAAAKPCALVYASASEVQVTRSYSDFFIPKDPGLATYHQAALALGSNVGDRFYNIEYALRLLETPGRFLSKEDIGFEPDVNVVDTSFLYETAPMYVTDQPAFVNGACLVETNLQPLSLLQLLKAVEEAVGRIPTYRNGPRVVDLDLVIYDDLVYDTRPSDQRSELENLKGELVIPHPRLQEREFVLRPLNDVIPDYIHPKLGRSIAFMLDSVVSATEDSVPGSPMRKVIPFPVSPWTPSPESDILEPPPTLRYWYEPPSPRTPSSTETRVSTRMMAILNATPDSFSNELERHETVESALAFARKSITSGADIIDVGGYSTRPNAKPVSVEEEIQRVIPVVQAIRTSQHHADQSSGSPILMSVDTFRWEVAEAAIQAGVNCINDVYGFTGSKALPTTWKQNAEALEIMDKMKELARRYATPVVVMHSRADAGQNKDYSEYKYAENEGISSIIEGVRVELGDKVDRIVKGKGGLRRWFVVVDPGVGFSKTLEDNLELVRNGSKVVDDVSIGQGEIKRRNPLAGMPTLVGTSRKSFLGAILSQDQDENKKGRVTAPQDRVWATTATIPCAIQQGAMVVRIHDVQEMADVVAVADALWA